MIAKIIALIAHEIKDAYDEIDDGRDKMRDILKVNLTDLVTEIVAKKDNEEEDRNPVGFSLPRHGRDTKTVKD